MSVLRLKIFTWSDFPALENKCIFKLEYTSITACLFYTSGIEQGQKNEENLMKVFFWKGLLSPRLSCMPCQQKLASSNLGRLCSSMYHGILYFSEMLWGFFSKYMKKLCNTCAVLAQIIQIFIPVVFLHILNFVFLLFFILICVIILDSLPQMLIFLFNQSIGLLSYFCLKIFMLKAFLFISFVHNLHIINFLPANTKESKPTQLTFDRAGIRHDIFLAMRVFPKLAATRLIFFILSIFLDESQYVISAICRRAASKITVLKHLHMKHLSKVFFAVYDKLFHFIGASPPPPILILVAGRGNTLNFCLTPSLPAQCTWKIRRERGGSSVCGNKQRWQGGRSYL
ncbi:hypothetical protein VP01_4191g2 [Puccinia sorghi]|uniref:Uncharacterized protein n=1 Tax=Puccinia sorghi TaxID=27349 RepID=A0A0L6UQT8_9BASI|nr:hypothetical protein VP01_4191g2 [Puccinia sorghi]